MKSFYFQIKTLTALWLLKICLSLIFFVFLGSYALGNPSTFLPSIVPTDDVKQWMEQRFAKGVIPPFSFVYGGKKSDSFIRNWQYQFEKTPSSEPNQEKYLYHYTDRATGLTVKCTVTCFTDFPAVEWVLHFSNASGKNTPAIEKVAVADHSFIAGGNGDIISSGN